MTIKTPMPVESPVLEKPPESLPLENEGYQSVLKNRDFLLLWLGQIFSQLGDRVIFVVFVAALVHYFGDTVISLFGINSGFSIDSTSVLYIAFTIPAIFLTAVAGVFVDRWPRRAVLVTTNVLRAVLVAFLPWAASTGLWAIYATAFFLSVATQFFVPAEAATIPMVVRKTQLIAANSLFTTTMMASVIFGFALGDPLINIFGIKQVHWAIVGLFVLASIILAFVKPPAICNLKAHEVLLESENPETKQRSVYQSVKEFIAELKDGIDYISANPLILQAMLKLALLFSAVVAMCILFISFAKEFLYDDPAVAARKFAYIITYSGIGMALGALLVGRYFINAKRSAMVYGGFFIAGASLILLGFINRLPADQIFFTTPQALLGSIYLDPIRVTMRMVYTYGLATIMGAASAFVAIPLQSLLHEIIPEDKRGKILGVQFTILSTCSTLPVLVAGVAVGYIGTIPLILTLGLSFFSVGLYGLYQRLTNPHATTANW